MEDVLQDLRFGARTLRANPGFTAVAVITLALGIGANTAMFSVINAVLLRTLDFPAPEQLVAVQRFDLVDEASTANTTPANFLAWSERSTSFAAMATVGGDIAALTGHGDARQVTGLRSAGSLLEVLGTPAMFGRIPTRQDDTPNGDAVVLSHALWRSLFGADRDILGDRLVLDAVPHTIVGVMPADFEFPYYSNRDIDFWAPARWSLEYRQNRGNYAHEVVARLAPGVSLARAQEEMNAIAAQLRDEFPVANRNHGIDLVPLHEDMVAAADSSLFLLMGAVGVVLLIATVNLANLLLARAGARDEEIAVRRAIGATPLRLARQVLTESILLASLGAVAGLALAALFVDVVAAMIPGDIPYLDRVGIDPTVLAFTLAIALLAGLAFGLTPALRLSRSPAVRAFAGRGSRRTSWTWSAFVVVEVALSVVLLVAAGLLLHSFVNLLRVDPGFAPERVLTFSVALPAEHEPERRVDTWRRIRDELEQLPGVSAATVANQLPAEPNRASGWFNYLDHPVAIEDRSHLVPYRLVGPRYFEALGIPINRGHGFTAADGHAPLGAIVNEAAAQRFWPQANPLGARIGIGSREGEYWFPPATVIAVVGNVRNAGLAREAAPAIYFPIELAGGWTNMTFAMRTHGEPTEILGAARQRVRAIDAAAPIFNEITAAEMLARQLTPTRTILQLIGTFAVLGLAMSAIGVFGVLSYSVGRRTREIGIRTALGADRVRLTAMVVGQAMSRVLAGTALGVVLAMATGRALAGLLYDVAPADPWTIGGVTLVLFAVALLASYIPARRATRVDPTVALRSD